ncbi:MAG: penicillin-binding protein 2 [Holosporales bacterium]|nr:penicillin-binding protein 2 [Holosporales bacterium]
MKGSFFEGFALWRKTQSHAGLMESLRVRIIVSCIFGTAIFAGISYRLADLMVLEENWPKKVAPHQNEIIRKADITDRNGALLATSITTASCHADPSVIIDVNEAAEKLSRIRELPSAKVIRQKLSDKSKHFVWLARHITPQVQERVMDLGIPGIDFQKDYKRVYIHGNLFSHIIGCSDIDGNGVSGIEKKFNEKLVNHNDLNKKLILSLDLRIQSIMHEELQKSINTFKAIGGNVILMATSGEIIAMVSLPDFDPNDVANTTSINMFNRNTLGVFEPGSTLKILNVAIALDSGAAKINSMFDATTPIKLGRHTISDFRGKNRALTLAEAFVFSSNIAAVQIAKKFGIAVQKMYMKKFGIMDKVQLEIPEIGTPIIPARWTEATAMTLSYGYGISISPIQLTSIVSSIINDGKRVQPTLLRNREQASEEQVVSRKTSSIIRELMRAVICYGTGKKAGVEGMDIIGKTGTSYKICGKGYGNASNRARITTFIGGFPKDKPRYVLLVMLDDPKGTDDTYGFATAGWNAAPTAHNIFQQILPILDNGIRNQESMLQVTQYIKLN